MRVVAYQEALPVTSDKALLDLQQPCPALRERDLLVKVKAVSVNPVDVKIRANVNPPAGSAKILGWDASGVVEAIGPSVTLFKPGDEVFYAGALDRPGTNSEFHAVDERIVGPKPSKLNFAQAAALPLTSITAWEALFDRLDVTRTVQGAANAIVIIGAAGGVGSMAIQLARTLTNLIIIATASRDESRHWVKAMGAHHIIDHSKPLAPQIARLGIGAPAFVFSTTHTEDHLSEIAELIAPQGRMCLIDDPGTLNIMALKRKSASIHWEFMFTRSLLSTVDMKEQHDLLRKISNLIDEGALRTTMQKKMSPINAETLKKAHAFVESEHMIGKLVVVNWPECS